ncbi:MAG: hypothetical protein ACR2PS_00590 [Pseudomonadales bacterium]
MNATKCVGFTGVLLLSSAAQALDWNQDWSDWEVRPRVTTGVMQYKYEQESRLSGSGSLAGAATEIEVEDSLLFAEVGVSVFLGGLFVDLSYQKSDEGEDDFNQEILALGEVDGLAFVAAGDENSQRQMEREEFSLSIGYAITDRLGVFGGYKQNDTQFDDRGRQQILILALPSGETNESTLLATRDAELEQDGFFLGATYVWPFESEGWLNGAISIDLGVAFLDGDLTEDEVTRTEGDTLDPQSQSLSGGGDAVGLNLGIAWSGPITERLNYSISVDGYQYDYDADSDSSDFRDTLFRFFVGVSDAIDAQGVF